MNLIAKSAASIRERMRSTPLTYLTYLTHLTPLALGLLLSPQQLRAAIPPNDRFSNRITLSGTNITVTGSNAGASKEAGEPDHAGNAGGKSVWWTWTAPTNGEVIINTDDSIHPDDASSLDTLLG